MVIQEFTGLGDPEKLQQVGPLIKEYQRAVDLLTKRCSGAEEVVRDVSTAFGLVSDPAPAFTAMLNGTSETEQLKARVWSLRSSPWWAFL
jgi:hypothetical protein